jgi:hypothetical protein
MVDVVATTVVTALIKLRTARSVEPRLAITAEKKAM